ncbi:hypothetical protein ACFYT3_31940 [Nocardia amikacinitolerans]|uniref:hypothetical protein n=1 Tax=Nocardia amikacinitolerans TaxID=756689 RepID=UPI0020A2F5DC|nr:hypothetical protein [Nocardia amikacinitolerans]MCP2292073.1 hypothetical protein [Nocardia amikacinitolerans]
MSQNTISGLVATHMEAARVKADRRMEAAEARTEEANAFVRPSKEELQQVRAQARALGKQMAEKLKARGAALKAGR